LSREAPTVRFPRDASTGDGVTYPLIDDHDNGRIHITPTFRDSDFRQVLRMPREHRPRRQLRRTPQATRAQMVDDISPALVLGCLVMIGCVAALALFAFAMTAHEVVQFFRGVLR
jgi:hypothetical protein